MHPNQLAGVGFERDYRSSGTCGRVEHAVYHERRAFELELGPRAEVVGLEAPCDFQLVEVLGVDLIERRVSRPCKITSVVRPFSVPG